MNREQIIALLHASACSCVIANGERIESFHERGVKDLHRLLCDDRALLDGAFIADKVVGKGAAALMIAGGVKSVYADVMSRAALSLFETSNTSVEYGTLVDNIINRAGTDICPVEKLCKDCLTADECLPLISKFIESMQR
ncbi:MAG: DUF1893 domain-containing protein [Alistipes sp.]|nr:DUF1893 domain-containing protein [Alistipes sp.]MBQ5923594.1 DUF1893 domain-containing protein [Alistipes sp.]MBQ6580370.1 DUF1893 domain-containing protein [Alistipes sp.]